MSHTIKINTNLGNSGHLLLTFITIIDTLNVVQGSVQIFSFHYFMFRFCHENNPKSYSSFGSLLIIALRLFHLSASLKAILFQSDKRKR